MADVQIKVTGDFSDVMNQIKTLSGIGTKLTATFSDINAASRLAFGAINAGSKTANKTVQTLISRMQTLANSKSPLSDAQLSKELLAVEGRYGAGTKATGEFSKLILEAQQTAIRRALEDTTTGVNKGIDSLLKTLKSYNLEYTDADGKQRFQRIGVEAKDAIRTLRDSIAVAAEKSLEFISRDAVMSFGATEFGADWNRKGVGSLSTTGQGSAAGEISKVLENANNQIYKRLKDGLDKIVRDATSSGKAVSKSVIDDVDRRLSALKEGAKTTLEGDALARRLKAIETFGSSLRERIAEYNNDLVRNLGLEKLENQLKTASQDLLRKGTLAGKGYDLNSLFQQELSAGDGLAKSFDSLRETVRTVFKSQLGELSKAARDVGKFDLSTIREARATARAAGIDSSELREATQGVFTALREYRKRQQDAVKKSLIDDGRAIESALNRASQSATLTGEYVSSKLENLIASYKERGGNVFSKLNRVRAINRKALEERIRQDLASDAKLAAGIEQSYRIEALRRGIDTNAGDLPRLFKELANRKQQELQTAIDVFNERYAAALFDIKQALISGKPVNLAGFEAKWSREAGKVNAVFNKQSIADIVTEAAAERNARDLQAAADKVLKEQQNLVDRVRKAISTAGYKGTNVSVSTAAPLFGELQSAIASATNNTGALVVAVSQLRQNVFKGLSAEIKQLERDALAAGSVIKQSDIASIQGKIAAAAPNLLSHEVARLNAALANTVKTVDTAVRQASIDAVRNSLSSAAGNLQLTSRELLNQIKSASAELRNLGVTRQERLNVGEFSKAGFSLTRALQREAQLAQNNLRKQALGVIQNLSRTAELSAQAISDARKQFVAAGGNAADIARMGISGVSNNLNAKVAELIRTGSELPQDFVRFYNNLYQAAGATGAQLQSLMGTVKSLASTVNMNAAQAAKARVEDQIRRVFAEANALGRVISEHIYKGLESQAFAAGIDFKATFNADIIRQDEIRAQNALRQRAEGIIKPYEQMLRELTTLGAIQGGAGGVEAQLQYRAKIAAEGFLKSIRDGLNKSIANLELLRASKVIDDTTADAEIASLRQTASKIIADSEVAVAGNIRQRLNKIASQLKTASSGNDIGAVSKLSAELDKVRVQIDGAGLGGAKIATSAQRLARRLADVEQSVADRIAKNDTLKRAEQMIRSNARKLGSTEALNFELQEIRNAHAELIKAVRNTDRMLARKLSQQARQLQQQAREQFANRSMGGRLGRGGAGDAAGTYGLSEGVIRNYRRMLPMQMTDIFVGALTGQKWHYILLQQGGQLKDMFGGIGNAVKEVAKYLLGWTDNMTKFQMATAAAKRVLAGIAVGAIVGMALLMKKAADFNAQIRSTTVELKFKGVELSGEEFRAYSEQMSRSLGIARTDAAALFKQIAIDAKIPKEAFESLIDGIDDISTALGNGWDAKGLQETTKALGELFGKDGFKNFKELAADYALFTDEQYKSISAMYEQGDAAKAGSLAIATLRKNVIGAKDEAMTPFQKAVDDAKRELLNCLQVVGDGGPWQALFSNLASAAKGFLSLIGPISKAANAVLTFIGIIGNSAVKAGFTLGKWGTGAEITGLERRVKAWEERAKVAEAEGDYSSRDNAIAQHAKELKLLEQKRGEHEAIKQTIQSIGENQTELLAQAAGLNEKAKEALKTTTSLKAATAATGKLKVHPNSEGDKPGKRGGGRGSRASDAQKELEAQQKIVQQLREEYDQRSKMGKLAGLEYDLEHGKIKLNGIYLDQARELARLIDERALAEERETFAAQRKVQLLEHEISLQKELVNAQIETFRLTGSDRTADYASELLNRQLELQGKIRKIEQDLARKIERARKDQKSDEYINMLREHAAESIELEKKIAEQNLEVWKKYYKEREVLEKDWQAGYKKGVSKVIDWIYEIRSETASAVENWASGMADAIAKFARTGKLSFKDLANSILDDIARIASRQFVSALFGGFQQGWGTVPKAENGVAELLKSLYKKNEVQNVFVVNQDFSSFTDAANSLRKFGDNFSFNSPKFNLGNNPWGLSNVSSDVVNRIANEVSPTIKEGSNNLFSGLFTKIGDIFGGIGKVISNLFSGISFGGGSGGGFFSSLFSGIGNFFSSLFGLSSGGYTGPGGKYTPAGIVHAGEFVINAASTRKLGLDFLNRLNGYADGGYVSTKPSIVNSPMLKDMAGGVQVNVYNNSGAEVVTKRNQSGGVDVFIEQVVDAVAGNIAAGGSVAAAMQRTYALNRGAGLQRSGY